MKKAAGLLYEEIRSLDASFIDLRNVETLEIDRQTWSYLEARGQDKDMLTARALRAARRAARKESSLVDGDSRSQVIRKSPQKQSKLQKHTPDSCSDYENVGAGVQPVLDVRVETKSRKGLEGRFVKNVVSIVECQPPPPAAIDNSSSPMRKSALKWGRQYGSPRVNSDLPSPDGIAVDTSWQSANSLPVGAPLAHAQDGVEQQEKWVKEAIPGLGMVPRRKSVGANADGTTQKAKTTQHLYGECWRVLTTMSLEQGHGNSVIGTGSNKHGRFAVVGSGFLDDALELVATNSGRAFRFQLSWHTDRCMYIGKTLDGGYKGEDCVFSVHAHERAVPPELASITVTFEPGPIGIQFTRGLVREVLPGGQAQQEGVQVGWTISAVGRQKCNDFGDKAFQDAKNGNVPYQITLHEAFATCSSGSRDRKSRNHNSSAAEGITERYDFSFANGLKVRDLKRSYASENLALSARALRARRRAAQRETRLCAMMEEKLITRPSEIMLQERSEGRIDVEKTHSVDCLRTPDSVDTPDSVQTPNSAADSDNEQLDSEQISRNKGKTIIDQPLLQHQFERKGLHGEGSGVARAQTGVAGQESHRDTFIEPRSEDIESTREGSLTPDYTESLEMKTPELEDTSELDERITPAVVKFPQYVSKNIAAGFEPSANEPTPSARALRARRRSAQQDAQRLQYFQFRKEERFPSVCQKELSFDCGDKSQECGSERAAVGCLDQQLIEKRVVDIRRRRECDNSPRTPDSAETHDHLVRTAETNNMSTVIEHQADTVLATANIARSDKEPVLGVERALQPFRRPETQNANKGQPIGRNRKKEALVGNSKHRKRRRRLEPKGEHGETTSDMEQSEGVAAHEEGTAYHGALDSVGTPDFVQTPYSESDSEGLNSEKTPLHSSPQQTILAGKGQHAEQSSKEPALALSARVRRRAVQMKSQDFEKAAARSSTPDYTESPEIKTPESDERSTLASVKLSRDVRNHPPENEPPLSARALRARRRSERQDAQLHNTTETKNALTMRLKHESNWNIEASTKKKQLNDLAESKVENETSAPERRKVAKPNIELIERSESPAVRVRKSFGKNLLPRQAETSYSSACSATETHRNNTCRHAEALEGEPDPPEKPADLADTFDSPKTPETDEVCDVHPLGNSCQDVGMQIEMQEEESHSDSPQTPDTAELSEEEDYRDALVAERTDHLNSSSKLESSTHAWKRLRRCGGEVVSDVICQPHLSDRAVRARKRSEQMDRWICEELGPEGAAKLSASSLAFAEVSGRRKAACQSDSRSKRLRLRMASDCGPADASNGEKQCDVIAAEAIAPRQQRLRVHRHSRTDSFILDSFQDEDDHVDSDFQSLSGSTEESSLAEESEEEECSEDEDDSDDTCYYPSSRVASDRTVVHISPLRKSNACIMRCCFDLLPEDLCTKVLSHLRQSEIFRAAMVCRSLGRAASEPRLFLVLDARQVGRSVTSRGRATTLTQDSLFQALERFLQQKRFCSATQLCLSGLNLGNCAPHNSPILEQAATSCPNLGHLNLGTCLPGELWSDLGRYLPSPMDRSIRRWWKVRPFILEGYGRRYDIV